MERYRNFAWPAYTVAFMLVVIPFFDATMQLWPLKPGDTQWRFGAIGLYSNAFMIPALGLLVALATALIFGHARFVKVLGALCGTAAGLTTILLLLFVMDAVETRLKIAAAVRLSFAVASFTAGGKLILGVIGLGGMALTGWRSPSPKRATKSRGADLNPNVSISKRGAA